MNVIAGIFVYSWIITILFGLVIAISFPIFKDYYDSSFEVFIPLYNLFGFCAINGYDEKMGLLFLIPGVNIIMMMFMGYKLKDRFDTNTIVDFGLMLLPGIFIPVLAYGDFSNDKPKKEEKKEEPVVQEEPEEDRFNPDDSIFRGFSTKKESNENKGPYRAKHTHVNESFINSAPAERETIERVEKDDN